MHPLKAMLASASIAAALFAAPGLAAGGIPTGSFEIQFGGRQSIWMGEAGSSSGEAFCEGFAGGFDDLEFCDFQAFLDGKGKIYGYLEFEGWSGGLHFSQSGPVKGSQKGDDRSGISRVSLSIKLTGVASDGFMTLPVKASLRLSGQTTFDGLVSGFWDQSVCVQGFGCSVSQSPVDPAILTNGGWILDLEITDSGGGGLGGSARVEFGDERECFYTVSGKYSAKKDVASLSLVPTQAWCEGTSLRLKDVRLVGAPGDVTGSIAYSLFGFKGATNLSSLYALPGSSPQDALENHSANQQVFAFICDGTLTIAASVDPGACSWSLFGNTEASTTAPASN